ALAGLVEKHARLAGAEEAYIAIAPDLDLDRRLIQVSGPVPLARRFAVRASIAYKGAWVRRAGSFAKDAAGDVAMTLANRWLEEQGPIIIGAGRQLDSQVAERLEMIPGAVLKRFMAEGTIGTYPLQVVESSRSPGRHAQPVGACLVLSIDLSVDDVPWLGAAP